MMNDKQYLDQTIRNQIHLESLKAHEVKQFKKVLKKLSDTITFRLLDDELVDISQKDFDRLLKELKGELKDTLIEHTEAVKGALEEVVVHSYEMEAKSLNNAYPLASVEAAVTSIVVNEIMSKPLSAKGIDGAIAKDLLSKFADDKAVELTNAVRSGRHEGLTNAQIKQKIRGTRKSDYKDGILNVTSRQVEAITRTLVQHAAQQARSEMFNQNDDIVDGEMVRATLDGRTSAICRALDGRIFKLGEGKRPPFHINCRSCTIGVVIDEYRAKRKGKRASMHGVVEDQTYYEWLGKQSNDFQDDVLGKKRGRLFREGGLSTEKFANLQLNKNFKPLSLDEIREREPMAFAKIDNTKIGNARVSRYIGKTRVYDFSDIKVDDKDVQRLLPIPETGSTHSHKEKSEAIFAAQYEKATSVKLEPIVKPRDKKGNPLKEADYIDSSSGKTLDFMFTVSDYPSENKLFMNKYFAEGRNWGGKTRQIDRHLEKADIIPMDMSELDIENKRILEGYVLSLPKEKQEKIELIEVVKK